MSRPMGVTVLNTQASSVTATSYQIDGLRMELDHIKNQNAALILEIAELEALLRSHFDDVKQGESYYQEAGDVDFHYL